MGAKSLCSICERPMWYPATSAGTPVPGRVQHRAAGECVEYRPAFARPKNQCLDCGTPTTGERCRPCFHKSRRPADRDLCSRGCGRVVERAGSTLCRQHAAHARRIAKAEAAKAATAGVLVDLSKADELTITARALEGGTPHLTAEERERAACAGTDVDTWYQTDGLTPLAKTCTTCPLRARCLEVAVAFREEGYWAGTTRDYRRSLVRRVRRSSEPAEVAA